MFATNLPTVAVALAALATAIGGTHQSGAITYNGHAGLGASVYQHNQTDREFSAPVAGVKDGTSNTVMF